MKLKIEIRTSNWTSLDKKTHNHFFHSQIVLLLLATCPRNALIKTKTNSSSRLIVPYSLSWHLMFAVTCRDAWLSVYNRALRQADAPARAASGIAYFLSASEVEPFQCLSFSTSLRSFRVHSFCIRRRRRSRVWYEVQHFFFRVQTTVLSPDET